MSWKSSHVCPFILLPLPLFASLALSAEPLPLGHYEVTQHLRIIDAHAPGGDGKADIRRKFTAPDTLLVLLNQLSDGAVFPSWGLENAASGQVIWIWRAPFNMEGTEEEAHARIDEQLKKLGFRRSERENDKFPHVYQKWGGPFEGPQTILYSTQSWQLKKTCVIVTLEFRYTSFGAPGPPTLGDVFDVMPAWQSDRTGEYAIPERVFDALKFCKLTEGVCSSGPRGYALAFTTAKAKGNHAASAIARAAEILRDREFKQGIDSLGRERTTVSLQKSAPRAEHAASFFVLEREEEYRIQLQMQYPPKEAEAK
jgi:hypothetical protein